MCLEEWKSNIILVIEKVADLNFQYAVWVNGSFWHRVLDFGEAVNILDDYYFFEKVGNKTILFEDVDLQKLLISFSESLLAYEAPNDTRQILEDEKWLNVVAQAIKISSNSHLLILKK